MHYTSRKNDSMTFRDKDFYQIFVFAVWKNSKPMVVCGSYLTTNIISPDSGTLMATTSYVDDMNGDDTIIIKTYYVRIV